MFRVENDFPRIVDPIEGVGDVEYTVVIGSCMNFDKDIDDSMEALIENGN